MRNFRRLLILWMICWLPLSGAMAAVMSIAGGAQSSLASAAQSTLVDAAADADFHMPCHPANAATDGNVAPTGERCQHCELCHLVSALIPTSSLESPPLAVQSVPLHEPPARYADAFIEAPQRPPQALAQ